MSRVLIQYGLAATLFLFFSCGGQSVNAQDSAAHIDAFVKNEFSFQGAPGITVAVVKDGEVIYAGAYGEPKLGSGEVLTPGHVFHLASVSKPFVATAIMQLVEQGVIDLDEPVVTYLPYFKLADERYRDITVRQMLNHTSGMPDVEDYEWYSPQYDDGAAERYVRSLGNEEMLWAPGEGWQYSNMAFDTLGDVIAKVSGMSFEEYVEVNILRLLKMDNSSFIYTEIDESLRTTGHVNRPAEIADVYPYNRRHAPSSTLNSSVNDMTRWLFANLNGGELDGQRILQERSYEILWEPTTGFGDSEVVFGLSWYLGDFNGHRIAVHGGSDTGFRSFMMLFPDDDIGIIIASNWEHTDRNKIGKGIAALLFEPADAIRDAGESSEAQIRALREASNAAIERHDVAAVVSFLARDFHITTGSGVFYAGLDDEFSGWREVFEGSEDIIYVRTPSTINVSEYLPRAAESGTWVGTWTTESGLKSLSGTYLAAWKKIDDTWRIHSELFVTLKCEGAECS